MLFRYFLNDFEIVSVGSVIAGIALVFTFCMCCISTVRSLRSINIHAPFSLPWTMMVGLLLWMVLSVCAGGFHNMVTLPSWFVSTDFSMCSFQYSLSNFIPTSLHILKCSWAHTHYNISLCTVLLPVLDMMTQCVLLSRKIVDKVYIFHLLL